MSKEDKMVGKNITVRRSVMERLKADAEVAYDGVVSLLVRRIISEHYARKDEEKIA